MDIFRISCFVAVFSLARWYWNWEVAESTIILCLVAVALLCFPGSSQDCKDNADCSVSAAASGGKREIFGSRKYCGLRPNPMEAHAPIATYSLVPLHLPLPDLDTKQRAALQELETRVKDLSCKFRTDPGTLVRFMRARKFDVAASEFYFREAMRWWERNGIKDVLTTWNLEAYEQCFAPWFLSGGFLGHGHRGEMIAYERLSKCNWPKWVKTFPWEHIAKIDIVHCLRSLAACEEDSLRTGRPLGDGILVEDCDGFGWDQASLASARALNKLIQTRNFLMPECLSKILVVNAPKAWVYAWTCFSWILDDGIKEKVQIARPGPESIALLRKYISDAEIPAYLGGRKRIDGDPECRKILAPGGFPPASAFNRFFELIGKDDMHASRQISVESHESQAKNVPQLAPELGEADENSDRGCMFCGIASKRGPPQR